MQHSRDRDGEDRDVDAAFADPAFGGLKERGAPFAILRPDTGAVLWANAAAAAYWGDADPVGLSRALFGPDGRAGWMDGLARGLVPGRGPRLARSGLARGFGMRARTALIRAWAGTGGAILIGLAVPDAAGKPAGDAEAWRRPAWAAAPADGPGDRDVSDGPVPDGAGPDDAGQVLARRGQLAVLRDRLSRAVDGAVLLRLLWRTDAAGAVVSIDTAAFARLCSPLRFDGAALPDAVSAFDPAGGERLRSALATRATWAGVAVDLPVADGAATVPVALSGSPVLGPDRSFAGFRGFGTVDLGRLALAERRVKAVADPDPADADAEGASEAVIDAGPDHGAAAPPSPASGSPASGSAEAADPPPGVADGQQAGPRPPANVVQLSAFQALASGRFGASPVPAAPAPGPVPDVATDHPTAGERAAPSPGEDDEAPALPDDGPLGDQLAFLALGEALRARIDASGPGPIPAAGADGPAHPAGDFDEPASRLLDRLPVPLVATVGDRPVFANAAAAARLGHAGPDALLSAGDDLMVSTAEADRVFLRDAHGATAPFPARRVDVAWAGAAATLWLLGEPGAAEPRPFSASLPADAGEDRSRDLLDRVDDAVALLDASGRLRRLNRRGEGWFGRAEAEATPARDFTELLAPESRPAALALLGEVRNQRDGVGAPPLRRDVMARMGEGPAAPMLLTLGRLGASGFYATLRDLSALKRAETDRARTERDHARATGRLPDLLAKVSHEIRTPLGAILGFAEVMMDERFGPLGNPRYRDYLKDIHASGAQVVALVEDLLDLSRIEAGQLDLDVAAVDVNRVVAEAVAQMQPEAHRERVIMRTSLAGRIPAVLADERSARQIVKNLLSNAVKFNEPGGQVIVSTALGEAGAVLLRVRDTGVGMTDEAIAAALEPFGGLPARPPAHGNGLGLPLTRALVGANGASMTIRSRPREGTLVEVSFAAADPVEARLPA